MLGFYAQKVSVEKSFAELDFIYTHPMFPNSWDLHGSLCGFID